MNIGIFTDTYHPQINGVVTSIRTLEKELNKRGHKVFIFTVTNPNARKATSRVFRLPSMPFIFLPSYRVGVLYSPQAEKIVKQLNLDIIHTQTEFSLGLFGKFLSKKLRIPIVHTYHTMYEDYVHYISKGTLSKFTPKVAKELSRLFCNRCDAVIAPTTKVEEVLREYGVKEHIEVIPTGINLEPFKKANYAPEEILDAKKQYGIADTDSVILFVGRLAKEKSIDVIIREMPALLQKLPTAKLLIVGDGPIRKELQTLAASVHAEESIIFAGEQPWEQIGKFYQLGDVFVSASVTETQGLTFAEAMAAHMPVVAKRDKNLEGMIEDKVNGRVFDQNDQLANILYELLTHKEESAKIAQKAYDMIKPFSADFFGEHVEKLYISLLQKP